MTGQPADGQPIDRGLALLACPICASPFVREARVLHCATGHGFDLAKQGYVNLLRAPPPRNADTTEMVAARDRLLASGVYSPIRDAVGAACAEAKSVLEVGAGTGYYLAGAIAAATPDAHLALDVSVAAARRSARAGLATAVADTWRGLPVASGVVDRLLCVFAPRNPADFVRALAPNGMAVLVTPNPGHLAALRSTYGLLDVPEDKLERLDASMSAAGLQLADRTHIIFGPTLTADQAADLVAMGPNAFHRAAPLPTADVTVQVDVALSRYRKA